MPVQVQIDSNTGIAIGISETKEEIGGNEYIKIDEFDKNILGKKWNGEGWDVVEQDDTIEEEDNSEDLVIPEHPKINYSVLEFLRRFYPVEREAIKNLDNPTAQDFLFLLSMASEVDLEDSLLIEGLNYMTTINKEGYSQDEFVNLFPEENFVPILSDERAQQILTP